jgi:hypothetical protein
VAAHGLDLTLSSNGGVLTLLQIGAESSHRQGPIYPLSILKAVLFMSAIKTTLLINI